MAFFRARISSSRTRLTQSRAGFCSSTCRAAQSCELLAWSSYFCKWGITHSRAPRTPSANLDFFAYPSRGWSLRRFHRFSKPLEFGSLHHEVCHGVREIFCLVHISAPMQRERQTPRAYRSFVTTICMPDHIRDRDMLNCSRRPSRWLFHFMTARPIESEGLWILLSRLAESDMRQTDRNARPPWTCWPSTSSDILGAGFYAHGHHTVICYLWWIAFAPPLRLSSRREGWSMARMIQIALSVGKAFVNADLIQHISPGSHGAGCVINFGSGNTLQTAEAAEKVAEKAGWNGRSHVGNMPASMGTP